MPVVLDVRHDLKALERKLTAMERQTMPTIVRNALNDTARDTMHSLRDSMHRWVDRPTPWTRRGVIYKRASRGHLVATVYVAPNRWKYLRFVVEGGTAPRLHNVPINASLNQYGSMRRGQVRRYAKQKTAFVGRIGNAAGVWRRVGGRKSRKLRVLVLFEPSASYGGGVWPFDQIALREARHFWPIHANRQLRHAIARFRR